MSARKTSSTPPEAHAATTVQANALTFDRRNFLLGATAMAAGTAALAASQAPPTPPSPTAAIAADPRSVTYRETEHIRAFYKRARF